MKCTNELSRKAVVMSKFHVIIFSPCQDPSRADPWPGRILAEVRVSYR